MGYSHSMSLNMAPFNGLHTISYLHCILTMALSCIVSKIKTNFQNSFTRRFVRQFSMYISQRFPPNLQYFATPCESRKSKNVTKFSCWTWQIDNMLLHYLVKVKNPKMLLTLTAPQQSVDVFLWTLWGLDLTFNSS